MIMPLEKGSSKEIISRNIAELIRSGYKPDQAAAIAYKEARDENGSNKVYDINLWPEIPDNPISKVGVYPYSGAQISPELEPDKIYGVLRPEEELSDPECIESFKLVPWIDDHEMLGSADEGFTPAEKKGIAGVIGERVYFKSPYLMANLKTFSEEMKQLIESGKKQLSSGYRCIYELAEGVYKGQPYSAIQRKIRGNHLALVEEGRMGPDVAVLDEFKFTFDKALAQEIINMPKAVKDEKEIEIKDEKVDIEVEEKAADAEVSANPNIEVKDEPIDVKALMGMLEKVLPMCEMIVSMSSKLKGGEAELVADTDKADTEIPAGGGDMSRPLDAKAMDAKIEAKVASVMDAKERQLYANAAKKAVIAERASNFIGVFDHSHMTLGDTVKYVMDKMDIKAPKGSEESVVEAYLEGAMKSVQKELVAFDSLETKAKNQMDNYLEGGK